MGNLTEHLNKAVPVLGRHYTNKDYAHYKKAKSDPSELDLTNIDWLFDEFADAWDEQWTRKLIGNIAKNKKEKWSQALAGKSREELQQALDKAIMTLPLPPTIAEFIKLLPISPQLEGWNHVQSAELANKKIMRIVPNKYDEAVMVRLIFRDLECKIYETRNEHCDFSVCAVDGCYHYEIFDKPYLGKWLCKKHDGSYV